MREITITIDGKKYSKARPTVADWLRYMEFLEQNSEKVLATDCTAGRAAIAFALEYAGCPASVEDTASRLDLAALMEAYRAAEENILEVFCAAPIQAGRE